MTAPSKLDEARLRELAEAATGGKWGAWVKSGVIQIDNRGGDGKNPAIVHWRGFDGNDLPMKANKANAAFIAAANPATILALLDALSAERERADRAVKVIALIASRKQTCASDEVEAWELQGAARAFLATQKAEGAHD